MGMNLMHKLTFDVGQRGIWEDRRSSMYPVKSSLIPKPSQQGSSGTRCLSFATEGQFITSVCVF